jgi:hypothetical protein
MQYSSRSVVTPSYWPKAVMVSWKRSGGIRGHSSFIRSVLSSQRRSTSSRSRTSRIPHSFHSPVTTPSTIGAAMEIISRASTPNGRMPPIE